MTQDTQCAQCFIIFPYEKIHSHECPTKSQRIAKPTISSLTEQMIREFDKHFSDEKDSDNRPILYGHGINRLNDNVINTSDKVKHFLQTHFRTAAEQLLDSVREEDKKIVLRSNDNPYIYDTDEDVAEKEGNNERNQRLESAIKQAKE